MFALTLTQRLANLCSAIRATLGQRQIRQSPGLALNAHSGNEWGKISVLTGIQFPAVGLPSPHTFANSSPSSQHALLDHHLVSPFLDPRSLLISCFPTEPYQSLCHVFGMTYHLNSAPFLCLHRRHCQSQDIIFTCLLYPSPPGPSTQN